MNRCKNSGHHPADHTYPLCGGRCRCGLLLRIKAVRKLDVYCLWSCMRVVAVVKRRFIDELRHSFRVSDPNA